MCEPAGIQNKTRNMTEAMRSAGSRNDERHTHGSELVGDKALGSEQDKQSEYETECLENVAIWREQFSNREDRQPGGKRHWEGDVDEGGRVVANSYHAHLQHVYIRIARTIPMMGSCNSAHPLFPVAVVNSSSPNGHISYSLFHSKA